MPDCFVCESSARRRGAKNGFEMYSCPECGLLFVSPLPTDGPLLYTEAYFRGAGQGHGYVDYDRDKQAMTPTFETYLRMIEKAQEGTGRMLDVGAATGFFLDVARRRGWQTAGVEISDFAASAGRNKGLDIRSGTLESVDFGGNTFDAVTMWDVIEHVPDPCATLERARQLLRPGGALALNTPDTGSLIARWMGLKWHLAAPPEHLCLFSRESISRLLKRIGFEVFMVTTIGKRFTLQYVAQTLANWQGLPVWTAAAARLRGSRIGQVGVPINLRDNLFLLARKKDAG